MPGPARGTSPALSTLTRLIENTRASARTTSVFGDPVLSGDTTIVPVARITALTVMGGGTGHLILRSGGEGAGGTGLVRARPAGFLVLDGEGVRFRPIRQPATALALPLAVIAAVTATRILGVSLREARRRRRSASGKERGARRSG
ncbi:spore germination protein GerW family protein [Nocardiopsis sp. ATB16-24]|uniref:GerW family sporulation protein n=1 Tax=Nocardiopsis sp. ATB16-24 TaxID=3019555 RepID=UPI00255790AE|nr:spore germination protein GerW family protein [Nocardiopsis sp. ATB16-24]